MDRNVKDVMSKKEMMIWAKNVMMSYNLTRDEGRSANINFACPYTKGGGLMVIAYSKKSGKTAIARISAKDYQKNGYNHSMLIAQAIAYSRLIKHKVPVARANVNVSVLHVKTGMLLDSEREIVQVYHGEFETVIITKNSITKKLDTSTYDNTEIIELWE